MTSLYDQVLDLSLTLGVIRSSIRPSLKKIQLIYILQWQGALKEEQDVIAMEMTKWFDTNYHYIVPEFTKNQNFSLFSEKLSTNIKKQNSWIQTKPVIIDRFLLTFRRKAKKGFHRIELINKLLPIYFEILKKTG
jgi:5-methyltetrahydropteroyltriglutamate--homocysteine methyltransferase